MVAAWMPAGLTEKLAAWSSAMFCAVPPTLDLHGCFFAAAVIGPMPAASARGGIAFLCSGSPFRHHSVTLGGESET